MASHTYTRMDTNRVKQIAEKLRGFAETLGTIITVLQGAITALEAASFFSFGASAAVAAFLNVIKKQLETEKNKLEKLAKDVDDAVLSYLDFERYGKTRFYWGV